MSDSFAATERERYEELAAALMELAKVLMTLHTLTELDAADLTDLLVEDLSAFLDDALAHQSPAGPGLTAPKGSTARLHPLAAARHDRLAQAIRRTRQALQAAAVARIDAQAPAVRDQLVDAISSLKEAFRRLAATAGADPVVGAEITRLTHAINQAWLGFLRLGYERTAAQSGSHAAPGAAPPGTLGAGLAGGVDGEPDRRAASPGEETGRPPRPDLPNPVNSSLRPRRRPPEAPSGYPAATDEPPPPLRGPKVADAPPWDEPAPPPSQKPPPDGGGSDQRPPSGQVPPRPGPVSSQEAASHGVGSQAAAGQSDAVTVKPGNRQAEAKTTIDMYRVMHRSALHLSLWFKAKQAWTLWAAAARVRRWAAAKAGATKTLAIAQATDGDTYLNRGLHHQATRHYEASLNLLSRLRDDGAAERVRERLAGVERHPANADPTANRAASASGPAASPARPTLSRGSARSAHAAGATTRPGSQPPGAREAAARPATAGSIDQARETAPPAASKPTPADSPTDQQPAASPADQPAKRPAAARPPRPAGAPTGPTVARREPGQAVSSPPGEAARPGKPAVPSMFPEQPRPQGPVSKPSRGRPPGASRMSAAENPPHPGPGGSPASHESGPATPAAGPQVRPFTQPLKPPAGSPVRPAGTPTAAPSPTTSTPTPGRAPRRHGNLDDQAQGVGVHGMQQP